MMYTDEVESMLKGLCHQTGRVALIYEPKKGWTVTDQLEERPSRYGPRVAIFEVLSPTDWRTPTARASIQRFLEIKRMRSEGLRNAQARVERKASERSR